MLRLGNRKTKTVTVTQNLVLEFKYDTVEKKEEKMIMPCPVGQATEIFTCPTEQVTCPGQSGSPYCHTLDTCLHHSSGCFWKQLHDWQ